MKMRLVCWCLDILYILLSNAASSPFSRWYQSTQAIMIRVYLLLCRQAYLVTSYWCMQCNMPAAPLNVSLAAVPMFYILHRNNYWFSIQSLWCDVMRRSPYLRSSRDVIWQGDNIVTLQHHNTSSHVHTRHSGRGIFSIKILISKQKWMSLGISTH